MQTFLPHGPDFAASAQALDQKRLNKQGVESYQILRTLAGVTQGWKNHPAVIMWRGHESTLFDYSKAIYNEIRKRDYKADLLVKIEETYNSHFTTTDAPAWLNDQRLSITHRGRLWVKNPEHYWLYEPQGQIYEQYVCCPKCLYFWPSHEARNLAQANA